MVDSILGQGHGDIFGDICQGHYVTGVAHGCCGIAVQDVLIGMV